jgi:mono/diheme cytochrome c family protein
MKTNQTKVLFIIIFSVAFFVVLSFSNSAFQMGSTAQTDIAATYKAQCQACHTAKAEKFFDPNKEENILVEITLKGVKGEKPPFMPGFEAKGMTAEQAKKLIEYMKHLRLPNAANAQNTNPAVNNNTANCTCNCNCGNSNIDTNTNSTANANIAENVAAKPDEKAIAEASTTYKAKCQACHTALAAKFFDTAKTDEQLAEAILKGKKGEKPPFMPGYEANGMTNEQAKTLVYFMRQLKASAK